MYVDPPVSIGSIKLNLSILFNRAFNWKKFKFINSTKRMEVSIDRTTIQISMDVRCWRNSLLFAFFFKKKLFVLFEWMWKLWALSLFSQLDQWHECIISLLLFRIEMITIIENDFFFFLEFIHQLLSLNSIKHWAAYRNQLVG